MRPEKSGDRPGKLMEAMEHDAFGGPQPALGGGGLMWPRVVRDMVLCAMLKSFCLYPDLKRRNH